MGDIKSLFNLASTDKLKYVFCVVCFYLMPLIFKWYVKENFYCSVIIYLFTDPVRKPIYSPSGTELRKSPTIPPPPPPGPSPPLFLKPTPPPPTKVFSLI